MTFWESSTAAVALVRDFAKWPTETVSLRRSLLCYDVEENRLVLHAVVQRMQRLESLTIRQGVNKGISMETVQH